MQRKNTKEVVGFFLLVAVSYALLLGAKLYLSPNFCPATQGINGMLRKSHVDYLFVGSSRTRQSYDAKLIERTTGKSAYVLAYNGMQPHSTLELLKYLVGSHRAPTTAVVVEAYPYGAIREPHIQDTRLFYNSPFSLKKSLLSSSETANITPSEKYSLIATDGNEVLLTYPIVRSIVDRMSYNGSYANHVVRGMSPSAFAQITEPKPMLRFSGEMNALQVSALRELFVLSRRARFSVIMVEPPVPPQILNGRVYRKGRDQLMALAKANNIPYITVGGPDFDNADNMLFADPMHLSTKGRSQFSRYISSVLKTLDQ